MKKKISVIILSSILILSAVFAGTAYYLNKPGMVIARALSSNNHNVNYNGSIDFKVGFDTSKLMLQPDIANNPFALMEINAIKSVIESANIKLSFNGTGGDSKLLLNGGIALPAILGKSEDFKVYAEENNIWTKSGTNPWVKSNNSQPFMTRDHEIQSSKAALDFIKSCPYTINGNTLTLSIKPKYEDIRKILPAQVIDSINTNSKDGLTLEKVMDMFVIDINLIIEKNNKFFIPQPFISKADVQVKGEDLSDLSSSIKDATEEDKAMLQAISFSATGTVDINKAADTSIEKPADIK